jgi:predicted 3-demethylubiquinone-9 3-methyltransferase (glyoxalase superfamily)
MKNNEQKITPFLWFDDNAEDAINFYTSIFDNSKINSFTRMPDGKVLTGSFQLNGQNFAAINGGSMFQINPSISFYVACETVEEATSIWHKLIEGGSDMMTFDTYPWSEKYGWLKDRFGMTWQITVDRNIKQKITPAMLFTQNQHGKGKEALDFYTNFYTNLFENASIVHLSTYQKGQNEYATEGMVLFSYFLLEGQSFIIMDAGSPQPYTFNEAVSLVINCENQEEIDHYWNKITKGGGSENKCGWAKDKYGVSWQIIPPILMQLMGDSDPVKAQNVMQAMFKMKKIEIKDLQKAYDGA